MVDLEQPPVVDDARISRALEWVRGATEGDAGRREHLPAIEEAVAAYNPNCGARTVSVVDDAARLMAICQNAHDRLLRGDDDSELLAILEQAWNASRALTGGRDGN